MLRILTHLSSAPFVVPKAAIREFGRRAPSRHLYPPIGTINNEMSIEFFIMLWSTCSVVTPTTFVASATPLKHFTDIKNVRKTYLNCSS